MNAPWNNPDWNFYQFMYRNGEAIVAVVRETGEQYPFYVTKSGKLTKMLHKCRVRVVKQQHDHFMLQINGKTQTKMQGQDGGHCVGHSDHWKGRWTPFIYDQLVRMVHGYLKHLGPEQALDHPSGLPPHELERCQACESHYSSIGCCPECYNTGLVPKQQNGETEMSNTREMITVMQLKQGAKAVAVVYASGGGTPYHFKNCLGVDLKEDDLVVVETSGSFQIAKIVDPDVQANQIGVPLGQLKHVVAKVHNDTYQRVLEAENSAMHALALSEVTERLNTFKEQVGEDAFNTASQILIGKQTEA